MSRKNIAVTLILIALLGCGCGWLLWQWRNPGAVSPVSVGDENTASKQKSKTGFCCAAAGSACEPVTDPGLCFRAGGKAFNAVQKNCDYYCLNVKL